MKLSPKYQIYLSDLLNALSHNAIVASSMIITALIAYMQNGTTFDFKTLGGAIIVLLLNTVLVLVKRWEQDNTNAVIPETDIDKK